MDGWMDGWMDGPRVFVRRRRRSASCRQASNDDDDDDDDDDNHHTTTTTATQSPKSAYKGGTQLDNATDKRGQHEKTTREDDDRRPTRTGHATG